MASIKGVRNDTPLPLNVIVSAMRKSGFNNAYDQLSKEIEQYINELLATAVVVQVLK